MKDPRSKGIVASRDPRQRAHAQTQPAAGSSPITPAPAASPQASPAMEEADKKPVDSLLDQAQPQNALQAAILARAKAQMEAAKAQGATSPSQMSPKSGGSPNKDESPQDDMDADDYSSSDNDIDIDINDPIVQAYAKKRRPKRQQEEEQPYEPADEEPYDPLCPDIPELEKAKHTKQQQSVISTQVSVVVTQSLTFILYMCLRLFELLN